MGSEMCIRDSVVTSVKHFAAQPLIVKLSPEVTDISEIAKAAVSGGADAISLINTLRGMKIDIHKRKTVLANKIGGYSGPGIMPIAVRMVYEAVSYTHLRAHETDSYLVCRLLLEKKK